MDRNRLYTGEHTPLIKLAGNDPRGIQQGGLALRKSRAYSGRVVLAGEPGVAVTVSLVWGPGTGDRQTIPITGLRDAYAKFPLQFTAAGDTENGRMESPRPAADRSASEPRRSCRPTISAASARIP
jgi:alpha-N-arabinofuranosidase